MGWLREWTHGVRRRKYITDDELEYSDLRRCLKLWDVTALGTGSTLGFGVWVIIGSVALKVAGPSIVLSFLIAAIASLFAGLCYAEFASRVPKVGSAYLYTYVAVGEFAAFLVGWNMILEGIFCTATVARTLSLYVDAMANGSMSQWFESIAPIRQTYLSTYFDLLAFFLVIVIGVVLSVGIRGSFIMNNIFTIINVIIIAFVIFAGAFKASSANWNILPESVPELRFGDGGFFPYGVEGMLKGAAYCFIGFTSYDAIANTAEEVQAPRQTILRAILLVQLIAFLGYTAVAIVVTMMAPYYSFDDSILGVAAVFSGVGWEWAKWVVSVGAIFGILSSLFSNLYPVPRVLFAMGQDGLMPCVFTHTIGKSPVVGTTVITIFGAILAGIFRLEELLLFLAIGTLISYTMVAICVIVHRHRSDLSISLTSSYLRQMLGCGDRKPSYFTSRASYILLAVYVLACVVFAAVTYTWWSVWVASTLGAAVLVILLMLLLQPRRTHKQGFLCPLVPIVPCLSIACNVYLMVVVDARSWIRIAIWTGIGIFCYMIFTCIFRKKRESYYYEGNVNEAFSQFEMNGKAPVEIIVEEPTPPNFRRHTEIVDENHNNALSEELKASIHDLDKTVEPSQVNMMTITEETKELQSVVEHNEEKEANIIDLLDQVIQAEEETYGDVASLSEAKIEEQLTGTVSEPESMPHRQSFSNISDAESEGSLGNPRQYDVVAQVHREDLPKLIEENNEDENEFNKSEEEQVTFFNESESASRTDESGYSDTTDNNNLNESTEELKEPEPYIPPPPPMDENYFASSTPIIKKIIIIPAHTIDISKGEELPRGSTLSNSSHDDNIIVFGSERQQSFSNKLSGILLKQVPANKENEGLKRSKSVANLTEIDTEYRERPSLFLNLKKELMAGDVTLKPVKVIIEEKPVEPESEDEEDESTNRQNIKSRLESIFASGGAQLVKPRLMKSNPPTPEDTTTENVMDKLPKVEKSNTLKLQKARFSEVLNSFKMLSRDDKV